MPYAQYTPQEVARQAKAIYEERIRPAVEATRRGQFVLIDIESGDYEIDKEDLAATKRLLARRPQAVLFGLRVGYPAAYRLGRKTAEDIR